MNLFRALLLVFLLSPQAWSDTFTENFDSFDKFDSANTTLVWNAALGYLHPTLLVTGAGVAASGDIVDQDFSVGQGTDGAFTLANYAKFGGDVNTHVISLDTNTPLEVTTFHLEAGWTLRPTGSQPLIIHSQSDVIIDGVIDCTGEDGTAANADMTVVASGGSGRCGGKNGGNGGTDTLAATAGGDSNGSVTGGHPGAATGAGGADGGGGGGAFGNLSPATAGTTPSGAGDSAAGVSIDEPSFIHLIGGSGGGGGAAFTTGGVNQSSGAGGGGGGGIVEIFAVRDVSVSATGAVHVEGGAGGDAGGVLFGGGGGGGGGGSIMIWAAGNISMAAANTVTALESSGGVSSGGFGGDGSSGRTWLTVASGSNITGNENPGTTLPFPGSVAYTIATQHATSKSFDMYNTSNDINSVADVSSVPGGSTILIEAATSNDNFISDDSGWIDVNNLNGVQGRRYVKFRVTLGNADPVNPASTQSITIDYTHNQRGQFDFQPACGRMGNDDFTGGFNVLALALLLLGVRIYLRRSHLNARL